MSHFTWFIDCKVENGVVIRKMYTHSKTQCDASPHRIWIVNTPWARTHCANNWINCCSMHSCISELLQPNKVENMLHHELGNRNAAAYSTSVDFQHTNILDVNPFQNCGAPAQKRKSNRPSSLIRPKKNINKKTTTK